MFEKEAEEFADGIYHYKINVSDYGEDGIINYRYSDIKEAYIKGAEPREKRIAELEKENAELKGQVEMGYEVYNNNLDYSQHIEEQLTKAKEIIKSLLKLWNDVMTEETVKVLIAEAEQFLNSEVEK